jgi:ABC-type transport system involved in multi-copper enzyme maturation permease subunit
MPIYDQTYRHWKGTLKSQTFRWWIITKEGLKIILKNKLFLLFIMAPPIIVFLVHGAIIYGVNVYGRLANLNVINPNFFYRFIMQQTFFIAVICVFAGSGLISNDLKYNALQFYFSKPLNRMSYLVGKFVLIILLMCFITLAPGIILFIENGLLSNLSYFLEDIWLLGAIVLYCFIVIIPTGLLILALSSTTKNSRYAGIIFISILVGTPILGETLREVLDIKAAIYVSYWRNLDILGREIFAIPNRYNWYLAMLVILGIIGFCIWLISRNIKEVEITK